MPIRRCTLPGGKQGYQWGGKGKCYASRKDAEAQAAAAHANGFEEKMVDVRVLRLRSTHESTQRVPGEEDKD